LFLSLCPCVTILLVLYPTFSPSFCRGCPCVTILLVLCPTFSPSFCRGILVFVVYQTFHYLKHCSCMCQGKDWQLQLFLQTLIYILSTFSRIKPQKTQEKWWTLWTYKLISSNITPKQPQIRAIHTQTAKSEPYTHPNSHESEPIAHK